MTVINRLSLFFHFLWWKIIDIIRSDPTMHHEEEISEGGTFTVTGRDSIVFKLPSHHRPRHVFVDFDGSYPPVTCNPHQHDRLEWNVEDVSHHGFRHRFELFIEWHVSGVRKIRWYVKE